MEIKKIRKETGTLTLEKVNEDLGLRRFRKDVVFLVSDGCASQTNLIWSREVNKDLGECKGRKDWAAARRFKRVNRVNPVCHRSSLATLISLINP